MYEKRTYRNWSGRQDLASFEIVQGQSDLQIQCSGDFSTEASRLLGEVRRHLEEHAAKDDRFITSLAPYEVTQNVSSVVSRMTEAAIVWEVGPMAAIAGAVAQYVGEGLGRYSDEVIVENGGDLYIKSNKTVRLAVYAGDSSPFGDKLCFELSAPFGLGVCTSSGVVGPSLSFGKADAVVAIAKEAAFADAAATSIANKIKTPEDVEQVVNEELIRGRLLGLIACCEDKLGAFGDIELSSR